MFPLKRRRKFARIDNQTILADITIIADGKCITEEIDDLSASGCKLKENSVLEMLPDDTLVMIAFKLKDNNFSINASKVRGTSFNFIFDENSQRAVLNEIVLEEYFKDTPEFVSVSKK